MALGTTDDGVLPGACVLYGLSSQGDGEAVWTYKIEGFCLIKAPATQAVSYYPPIAVSDDGSTVAVTYPSGIDANTGYVNVTLLILDAQTGVPFYSKTVVNTDENGPISDMSSISMDEYGDNLAWAFAGFIYVIDAKVPIYTTIKSNPLRQDRF